MSHDLAHDTARVVHALARGQNPDNDPETAAALKRVGAHVACCDGCASPGCCDPYSGESAPKKPAKKKEGK